MKKKIKKQIWNAALYAARRTELSSFTVGILLDAYQKLYGDDATSKPLKKKSKHRKAP